MTIVWACLAMALKDGIGTMLVIAEARGKALLAGALDAGNDLALVLVTLAGAGQVILHGWSARSVTVLAAMMLTSFCGTIFWTRVGRRITDGQSVHEHAALAALTERVNMVEGGVAKLEQEIGLGRG